MTHFQGSSWFKKLLQEEDTESICVNQGSNNDPNVSLWPIDGMWCLSEENTHTHTRSTRTPFRLSVSGPEGAGLGRSWHVHTTFRKLTHWITALRKILNIELQFFRTHTFRSVKEERTPGTRSLPRCVFSPAFILNLTVYSAFFEWTRSEFSTSLTRKQ